MGVSGLLAGKQVTEFDQLLEGYRSAGCELRNAVDGGAGSGVTGRRILRHISGEVYAYEPFPGNHRFFRDLDPRIRLIPKALAAESGRQSFRVASVVQADSAWGERGMQGYSSGGRLVGKGGNYTVDCVRADDDISVPIDFVKLDLQRGELNALQGMPRILDEMRFLWMEYLGDEDLLEWLCASGFALFDTPYLFWGEPDEKRLEHFELVGEPKTASNDRMLWAGFRREPWDDYEREFRRYRKDYDLVQTDLVCVKHERLEEFHKALGFI
jgi:FkbM family methyltransferase